MLPSVNQQTIEEMSFSLGYSFKQEDQSLFDLPFSYFKRKYDWLVDYKKKQSDNIENSKNTMPKIRSR